MLPSWIRSRNCSPAVRVLLGDRHDEAQVGLDQLLLRLLGLDLAARDGLERPHQLIRRLLQLRGHGLDLRLELLLPLQEDLLPLLLLQLALAPFRVELALE
jgi:hypothetical protein